MKYPLKKDSLNTITMRMKRLRQLSWSGRDSTIGPLFLLMLLVISSFASIITELDAWRQVCNLAESIFVVIASPATIDAVVESTAEGLESQEIPVKSALIKILDDTQTARLSFDALNYVRYESPPRLIHTCRSARPRGPPASG